MPVSDGPLESARPAAMRTAAERYRRFAEREVRGRSPLYERFALGVAGDRELLELLELLERLPPAKRQPNLFFAAVLYLGGRQPDYGAFRAFVLDHADQVMATVMARQTRPTRLAAVRCCCRCWPACQAHSP